LARLTNWDIADIRRKMNISVLGKSLEVVDEVVDLALLQMLKSIFWHLQRIFGILIGKVSLKTHALSIGFILK
jgi:hypothetical protein